jgi:putative alpha-1,2-mannosidase
VLGAPLFKKLTLHLDNGKQFVISAPNNSRTNLYVEKAVLNGQLWDKNWIAFSSIQQGGEIQFTMGATPNKARGTEPSDYPYSFSTDKSNPLTAR